MTRHRELLESDDLAAVFPIFRDAEKVIADPMVRNRGTIGGSLCQADPCRGPLDRVHGARRHAASSAVRRVTRESADARSSTVGPYETAVASNEMLVEVRCPIRRRFERLREGGAARR